MRVYVARSGLPDCFHNLRASPLFINSGAKIHGRATASGGELGQSSDNPTESSHTGSKNNRGRFRGEFPRSWLKNLSTVR